MTSRAVDITSPRFVTAKTAEDLQMVMRSMILGRGKQYDFFSIQQLNNGRFIAWYREEIKVNFKKNELVKDSSKE